VHSVVLPATFVLAAAISNGIDPPAFARPLLVAAGSGLIVTALMSVALRRQAAGALVSSCLFAVIVSREPTIAALSAAKASLGIRGATVALGAAVVFAIGGLLLMVWARSTLIPTYLGRITTVLNGFSVVLLVVVLTPVIPAVPGWISAWLGGTPTILQTPPGTRPDIYILLLDGHARQDQLSVELGVDDSAFLAALADRGFKIDPGSRSNFTFTAPTLTSLFAMDYIRPQDAFSMLAPELRQRFHEAITAGAGRVLLRRAGYELVATPPGWYDVSLRAGADRFLDRPELTELERYLLSETWLPDLPPAPSNWFFQELHKRILGILEDGAALAREDHARPIIAMIHVPSPHLPLASDAAGNAPQISSRRFITFEPASYGMTDQEYREAYGASIAWLDRSVLNTVDAIRSSDSSAVVIVMSDHGYHASDSEPVPEAVLRNLFASYTPDEPGWLGTAPTPVNMLRVLMAHYGSIPNLPLLPDRFWVATQIEGGRHFSEVPDPH
jgi:hypothetical protein